MRIGDTGTIKILKVGPGWKWQALGRAGKLLANGVDIKKSPDKAAEDAATFMSYCCSHPVVIDECPAVGKRIQVLPNVYLWRRS